MTFLFWCFTTQTGCDLHNSFHGHSTSERLLCIMSKVQCFSLNSFVDIWAQSQCVQLFQKFPIGRGVSLYVRITLYLWNVQRYLQVTTVCYRYGYLKYFCLSKLCSKRSGLCGKNKHTIFLHKKMYVQQKYNVVSLECF